MWSETVTDIARIENDTLYIETNNKNLIGEQLIYLKATDNIGSSTIQGFSANIININDPPIVVRKNVHSVGNQQWEEIIEINEGEEGWSFDPASIFIDNDPADQLTINGPQILPSWITIDKDRVYHGIPKNTDVGNYIFTWQAMDKEGKSAYYKLKLNVKNINESPQATGKAERIEVFQDDYEKFSLGKVFTDEDYIHGDSLNYNITVYDSEDNKYDIPEWAKINYVSTEMPEISDKYVISTEIYQLGEDGLIGEILDPNDISNLENGEILHVKIKGSDLRDKELKGIVGIDLDILWNSNVDIIENSILISKNIPLFNSISVKEGGYVLKLDQLLMH